MAKRKPIPQKIRFEVFKRDHFRCQYCGKGVNDGVILEVDHIHPVAEGGTNDIINLITACRECNGGKGARLLSDTDVAEKEFTFLEEEQARIEQAQMVIEWKKQILEQQNIEIDALDDIIEKVSGYGCNDNGKRTLRKLLTQFTFDELSDAIPIAFTKYYHDTDASFTDALHKLGGICWNWRNNRTAKDYI